MYDSEEVQAQLDQSTKLSTRLRFWHNAKLGLGGLGLFASAYSANGMKSRTDVYYVYRGMDQGIVFVDANGKPVHGVRR